MKIAILRFNCCPIYSLIPKILKVDIHNIAYAVGTMLNEQECINKPKSPILRSFAKFFILPDRGRH